MEIDKEEKELEKLDLILEKYNVLYDDYMKLINDREKIKIRYANKNKKKVFLNSLLLLFLTIVMFYFVNLNMVEIFKLFPNVCKYLYIGLFLISLGGEGYLLVNKLSNRDIIYEGLYEDDDYQLLLDRIKDKEKQLSNVQEEYVNFNYDLDDLKYNCDEVDYDKDNDLEMQKERVLIRKKVKDNN